MARRAKGLNHKEGKENGVNILVRQDFLSPGTLYYRLVRIKEIARWEPDDPEGVSSCLLRAGNQVFLN